MGVAKMIISYKMQISIAFYAFYYRISIAKKSIGGLLKNGQ